MKKSIALFALTCLFFTSLYSQVLYVKAGGSVRGITATFQDSAPLLPGFFIELESTLKNKVGLYAKSDFLFKSSLVATETYDKITSYGFSTGLKFYTKESLQGFFIGPELSYQSFDEKIKSEDIVTIFPGNRFPDAIVTIGLNLGFQKIIKNNLSFGMQTSLGIGHSSEASVEVVKFGFNAGLGYTF